MGKSSQYTHWMQRVDITSPTQPIYDIEEQFSGLLYMSAEGMNDVGKAKNIYTEEYADSDRLRVSLPKHLENGEMVHSVRDIANEATKITMRFLVVGDSASRLATISDFGDYLREGIHRYWDDARNLEFDFIVQDEIKVSDERWHGSQPYVEIQVPMQNLNGSTKPHV